MWTKPETEAQKNYFSKHAPERRVYGWIMVLFQLAHAALAFAAWGTVFSWALGDFPFLLSLVPILSIGTLISLHVLFRTTWETYWYDRLDSDPNTDSPIVIPIIIIVTLLGCEVYGASKFLEGKVEEAKKVDTRPISAEAAQEVARLNGEFRVDSLRIENRFAEKVVGQTAPYDAAIKRLKRQKGTASGENAKWINHLIGVEVEKRDKVIGQLKAEKAAELEDSHKAIRSAIETARGRHEKVMATTLTKNDEEETREKTEKSEASAYSWLISILLLGIIAVLGWRRVRINVKSGILPMHPYSTLDAHGSAAERIYTALSDAFNRRSLQLAVWLHARLSPKKALVSFDGTVVTQPGNYNTPSAGVSTTTTPGAGASTAATPGAPSPHPIKSEDQAIKEVLDKAAAAGVVLTPAQFRSEVELSRSMNGHYKDMPMGPTVPVEDNAPTTAGNIEQVRLRELLVEGLRHDTTMRKTMGTDEESYQRAYDLLYGGTSDLSRALDDLGLNWGRAKDGEFVAGTAQSGQYYPVRALLDLPYISFPPIQQQSDGFILFKQTGELFKQIRNGDGIVIGLEYKGPRMAQTTTLSYSQVQSRISSYRNNTGRNEETRKRMLAVWQGALMLFERNDTEAVSSAVEKEVENV